MKSLIKQKLKTISLAIKGTSLNKYENIFSQFQNYSMIPKATYLNNLELAEKFSKITGAVVECGTWRGGMIAGIAKLFSDRRNYFLFDSFEGLPAASEIDGIQALNWQSDKTSPAYYNNCKAEQTFAENAIQQSGVINYVVTKGWFSETLPLFDKKEEIAILRLDGDWYESTMDCLNNLYDNVVPGGIIIIDDYYAWDGCTRAVHDFLSERKLSDKLRQWRDDNICYIIKEGNTWSSK